MHFKEETAFQLRVHQMLTGGRTHLTSGAAVLMGEAGYDC